MQAPYRQAQRDVEGDANVDGGNRRRGRDRPYLVDRRDVQLGARVIE